MSRDSAGSNGPIEVSADVTSLGSRAGRPERVTFTLDRDHFSLVNAANEAVVESGEFDVWASDSSTAGSAGQLHDHC